MQRCSYDETAEDGTVRDMSLLLKDMVVGYGMCIVGQGMDI